MEPQISELTANEVGWLDQLLGGLRAAGVNPVDVTALGEYCDREYAAHAAKSPAGNADPNLTINRVGAGFGEHLRSRLPFRWVVVTDQWGTDLAITLQPGNVILTPMTMIGKRWSEGTTGFLPSLAEGVVAKVPEVIAEHNR